MTKLQIIKLRGLSYPDISRVFDLENGKRLIADYERIKNDFIEKANKKIKEANIKQKKKELERLQAELNGSN